MNQFFSLEHIQIIAGSDTKIAIPLLSTMHRPCLIFLAHPPSIFAVMITHYCQTPEEALKKTKQAGKQPGCYFGGITLPNGKKGFAIYKNGLLVERIISIIEAQ